MQIDMILPYLLSIPFVTILLIYLWKARLSLKWVDFKSLTKGNLLSLIFAFGFSVYVFIEDQNFGVENNSQMKLAIIICAVVVLILYTTEPREPSSN